MFYKYELLYFKNAKLNQKFNMCKARKHHSVSSQTNC